MDRKALAEWLDYLCEDDEPTLTARDFHVLAAIRNALLVEPGDAPLKPLVFDPPLTEDEADSFLAALEGDEALLVEHRVYCHADCGGPEHKPGEREHDDA